MEVHAHTHTPRKKWTHYFWEFFMLFLAVTAGFFVENQREHYIEHKREVDYVKLFVQDLKSDLAFFDLALKANKENQQWMDSLLLLLKVHRHGEPTDQIYRLARNITPKGISIQYSNRTFEQLKGSGGFRLIRKQSVLDSLTLYYESLKELDIMARLRLERLTHLLTASEDLFDGWIMNDIAESGSPGYTPPLLSGDRIVLNRYITRLGFFKAVDRRIIERVEQDYMPKAILLIKLIEKKYRL